MGTHHCPRCNRDVECFARDQCPRPDLENMQCQRCDMEVNWQRIHGQNSKLPEVIAKYYD